MCLILYTFTHLRQLSIPNRQSEQGKTFSGSLKDHMILHKNDWVGIALHPSTFVSDITICVLKGGVKLQLTNVVTGVTI